MPFIIVTDASKGKYSQTFPNAFPSNSLGKYIPLVKHTSCTHCHASLLIYLGCDSRDVVERLGDTVDVVENTYYHMFPKKKKHTLDILNNLN